MDDPKDREERIRARAYAIWCADGFPEGRHDEHWAQAERELAEQRDGGLTSTPATEPAMTAPPVPGVTTASDQAKTSAAPPAETKGATRGTERTPVPTL